MSWLQKLLSLLRPVPPKPWEDPKLPKWQRDMWLQAEPKSRKGGR